MRVMHAEQQNSYFYEAAYATTTTNMDNALTEIENLKPGEPFEYSAIAQKHSIDRSKLSRRHRNVTKPHAMKILEQRKLHPQQEVEFIEYLNRLAKRGLPPTRRMIWNFAARLARDKVSDSWVTRFL